MQQIVQNIRSGRLSIATVPEPLARPGQVLIANTHSVISAGTEKLITDLAKKSLVGKALERPDQVRRVIEKLKNEGVMSTVQQVRDKLDSPMPLGYSSAGIVLACGAGVQEFKPGDRVASNGPHAGVVSVPRNLVARVPDGVPLEQAALATLGSIALHGVRLAHLGLGETAFVIGLGLIGQITVALLRAQGCRVIGTDLDAHKCDLAREFGADVATPGLSGPDVEGLTGGLGADAVLITASTPSDGPITLAGEAVRKKGRVVAVGAVGLAVPRRPYYFKEAELVVSCSYGPGRYDAVYEERGHDYPAAYVRWTEQRNLQAIVDALACGRLDFSKLISHRFSIDEAKRAYDMISEAKERFLGIVLEYPAPLRATRAAARPQSISASHEIGVGCLGAGNFARAILLPALRGNKGLRLESVCSGGGLSAAHVGGRLGFSRVVGSEEDVLSDPAVHAVFVLTRHDQHGTQVRAALAAGKHVFVEKPLGITLEEIDAIEALLATSERPPLLMVGFNRRFSPAAEQAKEVFAQVRAPLTVSIRFNAGAIPADHWTQDDAVGGGRIIGEACHAIDLATYLVGARVERVYAESIGLPNAISDDQCFITLRHTNGSITSIGYLAGGDKAFPKERVEVIGGGRVAVIDDFKRVTAAARGKVSTKQSLSQDKGHKGEIARFVQALQQGGRPPIPLDELLATSRASILAVRSLREGVPLSVP